MYPLVKVTLSVAGQRGKKQYSVTGEYQHHEKTLITREGYELENLGISLELESEAESIPYYFFLTKAAEDLATKIP